MNLPDKKTIAEFVQACHKSAQHGLQSYSSGNLSFRTDDGLVLLSASRSWLGEITAEQVAICELESGKCINGLRPTVESVFHLGILRNRPEVNVVFHFQSPYATTIACGNPEETNFFVIPEIAYYTGKPAIVPMLVPGSEELANATIEAMTNSDIAILKNHGLVTVGTNYNDAIQKAGFFELACRVILTNPQAKPISDEMLKKIEMQKNGC